MSNSVNKGPLVFSLRLAVPLPSPSDKTADTDRLLQALSAAGYNNVSIPLDIARRLPPELRKNELLKDELLKDDCELALAMGPGERGLKVLDIGERRIYGIALDIGSTTLEASLFDLADGKKIDEKSAGNPQAAFGADVLTRVQLSMMGEYKKIARLLTDGVNRLIVDLCGANDISADNIFALTVAGNTIVSHFFLGLEVNNIPVSPYVPAVNKPMICSAGETGTAINKNAVVYVFPNSGSYVGGDIISGILYCGIHREESPVLFVDVGTNVEITLGCRDWLMVGAGAAGPALEGGIAHIGKRAEPGTISRVKIDKAGHEIKLDVISDIEPAGICGSGLIDLISEMFSAGVIDQAGRFTENAGRIVETDGVKAYLLHKSDQTELFLTEPEIKNFLLSKAAMFSFLYVFVRSVGLTFGDIGKIYVAGALGCGINPISAINIGMLPDVPLERFVQLGNSSLRGAEMLLLNRDLLSEIDGIAAMITYREMNEDSELMSILQGAMFIPHTDPLMLK